MSEENVETGENLSHLQRSVIALKKMRSQLDAMERSQREPIAIIGMGCRFPGGANDPESFWQLLHSGADATSEVPSNRWDVGAYYHPDPETPGKMCVRRGGFLEEIDSFDAEFFGLSPREAASMDPQQRLLLEVSWNALEHALIAPNKLVGSNSGVFVGLGANEYAPLAIFGDPKNIDIYSATGNATSVAAGRLSYLLGLQGPSLVVDTACSSSLVAVHLACASLRRGECHLALAGGAYLMTSPQSTIAMSKMRALSPDGRCKTFDADADGYGRGEGCGIVVLKRLTDAIAEGNQILAVIRGSAVNQDGRSSGFTVPNGAAQLSVISAAIENAKIEPGEISYVEAHGTGTSLGDPLEVGVLAKILGTGRPQERPLAIGSVKTNIGHLEAAAGIAGLIKVVLAMQHREIPPHINFQKLNPHISLVDFPLVIPTQPTPWQLEPGQKQLAGVSSFGFSGTNAHVILEESPEAEPQEPVPGQSQETRDGAQVLALSAKSETALGSLVERYRQLLESEPEAAFADICFSTNTGRSHFEYRLAIIADCAATAREALASWLKTTASREGSRTAPTSFRPQIGFLFTGAAYKYRRGRQLYATQPVFRKALDRCEEIGRSYLEKSLLELLDPQTESTPTSSRIALFALEFALAQLWQSWGIKPDLVAGQDVGEYTAACVAGVFSLEDGLKLVARGDRSMHQATEGETAFEEVAQKVTYSLPKIGLISNVTGQTIGPEEIAEGYWRHLGKPAELPAIADTLKEQGCEILIEIGPHGVAMGMEEQCQPEIAGTWLPSLKQGEEDDRVLLSSLAILYEKGVEVNWEGFYRHCQLHRRFLPTYPFERQRYWLESSLTSTLGSSQANGFQLNHPEQITLDNKHPLLDYKVRSPLPQFESYFTLEKLPLVKDHQIGGVPMVNLVIYLEMALAGATSIFESQAWVLENIFIPTALRFGDGEIPRVQLILNPESHHFLDKEYLICNTTGDRQSATFQIFSSQADTTGEPADWTLHITGQVKTGDLPPRERILLPEIGKNWQVISSAELYNWISEQGIYLGPTCQWLEQIWWQKGEAIGKIKLPQTDDKIDPCYHLPLGSVDACFQLLSLLVNSTGVTSVLTEARSALLVGLESFRFYGYSGKQLWGQAIARVDSSFPEKKSGFASDLRLIDEEGKLVLEVTKVQLKYISPEALRRASQKQKSSSVWQTSISKAKLLDADPGIRQGLVEQYLLEKLTRILQMPEGKINSQQSLSLLIDSLIAFELRSDIQRDLQIRLPMDKFLGDQNIAKLAELLEEQLAVISLAELPQKELTAEMEEIAL